MKLLKYWDLLYWALFIVAIIVSSANSPYLYKSAAPFGVETMSSLILAKIFIYILPAVFIWAVLKIIQKIVERTHK